MTNSIYLLRHCDYDNSRNIIPGRLPILLSSKGIEQANNLKKYFSDKSITKIYTSAVERCKQTAEILSGGSIPIVLDKRILETFSAYQGYWGENLQANGFHFFSHIQELGGESLADIQKRMADFWDEIFPEENGNVIICSHGDPLQVLYSYIHSQPLVTDEVETNAPGWMEKGEFIELVFEKGKLIETKEPKRYKDV